MYELNNNTILIFINIQACPFCRKSERKCKCMCEKNSEKAILVLISLNDGTGTLNEVKCFGVLAEKLLGK